MIYRTLSILLFLCSCSILFAQHPLSKFNKSRHLDMLDDGVLLVRLSSQEKKIEQLTKRGQKAAVKELKEESKELNDLIKLAFTKHYTYCDVYFIEPEQTKDILKNESNTIMDLATNSEVDLSSYENIYITDYGYGHPAEGFERYNRKGFQILHVNNGRLEDLGRDLFYVGVKTGIFSPNFSKSMQKSVIKLNDRLESGSKYF